MYTALQTAYIKKMIRVSPPLGVAAALGLLCAAASIAVLVPLRSSLRPPTGAARGCPTATQRRYRVSFGRWDRLARQCSWAILTATHSDVAVGTSRDGDGANHAGAARACLNADGTVKHTQKIVPHGMAVEAISKGQVCRKRRSFWVLWVG